MSGTKYNRLEIHQGVIKACDALLFRSPLDKGNGAEAMILRKLLNELVWRYSEAHEFPGKYLGCPWWSADAFEMFKKPGSDWRKEVALEHVTSRKNLIDELMASHSIEEVPAILEKAETCVILRGQHSKLLEGEGWKRYAQIELVPGAEVRALRKKFGKTSP